MKLINPLSKDDSYVYHYTSADTALNLILKNGTLKFNPFTAVNDPRERKKLEISPFVRLALNLDLSEYEAVEREVSRLLKPNPKIVCFCGDKDDVIGQVYPELKFSRGFTKPSMWHHYGNAHSGICLMFDRDKLDNAFKKQLKNERLVSGKVTYSNSNSLPSPATRSDPFTIDLRAVTDRSSYKGAIQAHWRAFFRELYLTKLEDWANEDEYRWIYFDDGSAPIFAYFEDALAGVVIGESVAEERTEEIRRYCVIHRAESARLIWRNGFPRIEQSEQPYITHKHLAE